MSQPAVLQLNQELRKCFQSLKENQTVWKGVLEECTPLVSSLRNLAEQLRALKSVEIANTPLCTFPNLPERLQHKLLNAVDTVLGELSEKVDALGSVRDSVSKQVSAVIQMYEQNSDSLPISTCVTRSALSPSIADMLEWLQDAERFYRIQLYLFLPHIYWSWDKLCIHYNPDQDKKNEYIQRRNLLQQLKPDDLALIETVPKTWTSLYSHKGEEQISDALLQVSFFMESD